jgi:hypothetical protein
VDLHDCSRLRGALASVADRVLAREGGRGVRRTRRPALVVIAVAAALGALASGSPALGSSDCVSARGSATTVLNPGNGRLEGWATFTIGGVTQQVFASTAILESDERGKVLFAVTSHEFTLESGHKVVTIDNARLVPTTEAGLYRLISRLEVVSGGSGFLVLGPGTLDLRRLPTATWETTGRLCGLAG